MNLSNITWVISREVTPCQVFTSQYVPQVMHGMLFLLIATFVIDAMPEDWKAFFMRVFALDLESLRRGFTFLSLIYFFSFIYFLR